MDTNSSFSSTDGQVVFRDFLKPEGGIVNVNNVQIGCHNYGTDVQPSSSGTKKPDDDIRITKSNNMDELMEDIRQSLKHQSKLLTLPSLPWVEKVDIPIQYYTKLELKLENDTSKKIIDIEDLFARVGEEKPKRILIEAQPGFGKTTLAVKIISDWGENKDYASCFKFAILIVLRSLGTNTVRDELLEMITSECGDINDAWKIINTEETLLILDGLDEVSDQLKRDIFKILYNTKNEYKMTILVTCRIGLSYLTIQERRKIFGEKPIKKEFWCKKITILGINPEHRNEFLNNFVHDEKEDLMPRLSNIIESRKEMFQSPLLIILLVYVTRDNHEITIKTNTDLYKQLVDCIIRRSISKTNCEFLTINFTLFEPSFDKSSPGKWKTMFHKFGETCLAYIMNDNLQFMPTDDAEAIHQLGFLLKREIRKKFDIVICYEGYHLSLLEFAASVFMASKFQNNAYKFNHEDIKIVIGVCCRKRSTSLVIPFLCGLLGRDVRHLFKQLSKYQILYWHNEDLIQSILQECEMDDCMAEHFGRLASPYYQLTTLQSVHAIENQFLGHQLNTVSITAKDFQHINRSIFVNILHCEGVDGHIAMSKDDIALKAKNIKCQTLICTSGHSWHYDNIAQLLKIFKGISSDCKNLRVYCSTREQYKDLERGLASGILNGTEINKFKLNFTEHSDIDVVAKIVSYTQAKHVILKVSYWGQQILSVADIAHLATKSCGLCTLHIYITKQQHELGLDFNVTSANSKKRLEFLCSNDIRVTCKSEIVINGHNLSSTKNSGNGQLTYKLDFHASMSKSICNCLILEPSSNLPSVPLWDGLNSIVELTIVISGLNVDFSGIDFGKVSPTFHNLKILTLEITDHCNDGVIAIIQSFNFLKLVRLEIIRFGNAWNSDTIIYMIRNAIENNEVTNFEEIRLINMQEFPHDATGDRTDRAVNFETIRTDLLCDSKVTCYFYFHKIEYLRQFLTENQSGLLKFNVAYSFDADGTHRTVSKYNLDFVICVGLDVWDTLHILQLIKR